MLKHVDAFPGVIICARQLSLVAAVSFQLGDDVTLANPNAIVGGREFAHVHTDGSLNVSLEPVLPCAPVVQHTIQRSRT
ncbi:MAG: hypothetical protein ACI9ND_003192 [Yoonia sp.]|jgi:phospholipase/carboxylesterase